MKYLTSMAVVIISLFIMSGALGTALWFAWYASKDINYIISAGLFVIAVSIIWYRNRKRRRIGM